MKLSTIIAFYILVLHDSWKFMSVSGNIAYRIYRKKGAEELLVVPLEKVDCHLLMEEGHLICEQTGKCKSQVSFIS